MSEPDSAEQRPAFRALWLRSTRDNAEGARDEAHVLMWLALVAESRLAVILVDAWSSVAGGGMQDRVAAGARLLLHQIHVGDYQGSHRFVFRRASVTGCLEITDHGYVRVSLAASTRSDAEDELRWLHELFPKPVVAERVPIKFWSFEQDSPCSYVDTVERCPWSEIGANYAGTTREALAPLMESGDIGAAGKLLLWLGPPGTGKTYALRALAWEQRERIEVHYVIDPEAFLTDVSYLKSVFHHTPRLFEAEPQARRTRLVVLEDAGELLGADARTRAGQGLSRLLNLTDGLPGHTTPTRVLITTNEETGRLHPAVTRPGRCGSLVRFTALDEAEAAAWLRARGRDDLVTERPTSATIADLFARVGGHTPPATAHRVGFQTP